MNERWQQDMSEYTNRSTLERPRTSASFRLDCLWSCWWTFCLGRVRPFPIDIVICDYHPIPSNLPIRSYQDLPLCRNAVQIFILNFIDFDGGLPTTTKNAGRIVPTVSAIIGTDALRSD